MCDAIQHRGPDDWGVFVEGGTGLGARRLSIIDIAGGHQPIANEDGTLVVVMNGEIYNYPQLRPELEAAGHRFRTRTDTEVLLHLYEQYGEGMLSAAARHVRLRALGPHPPPAAAGPRPLRAEAALLHRHRRAASPSRPRSRRCWPTTPAWRSSRLSRSTSTSPCGSCSRPRRSSPGSARCRRRTTWSGRTARRASSATGSSPTGPSGPKARRSCSSGSTRSLADAVSAHLLSDVPVGAFLSGGLDSTLIASYAARELGSELRTFSMGIPYRDLNELPAAAAVAAQVRHPPFRGGGHSHGRARPPAADRRAGRAGGPALDVPAPSRPDDRARGEGGARRRRGRRAVRGLRPLLRRPVAGPLPQRAVRDPRPGLQPGARPAAGPVHLQELHPQAPLGGPDGAEERGRALLGEHAVLLVQRGAPAGAVHARVPPEAGRGATRRVHSRSLRQCAGGGCGGPDDVRGHRVTAAGPVADDPRPGHDGLQPRVAVAVPRRALRRVHGAGAGGPQGARPPASVPGAEAGRAVPAARGARAGRSRASPRRSCTS